MRHRAAKVKEAQDLRESLRPKVNGVNGSEMRHITAWNGAGFLGSALG